MRRSPFPAAPAVEADLLAPPAPATTGVLTAARAPGRDDVAVIAHRGSSGIAPENTLAAVHAAVRQGADMVENDIHRTADGELVVVHDATLSRTTDVEQVFPDRAPWRVGDLTLAEIRRLDAGSWFAEEFAGERVPTLQEWLDAVGTRSGMLLEVKAPALYPGIEHQLDQVLRSLPHHEESTRAGRMVVQSFDHGWLRRYAELAPEMTVGALFAARPGVEDIAAAAGWAHQVNPGLEVLDEATVTAVHDHGLAINVWTVDDGRAMRRARAWGVDGIITNYPQVLLDLGT